MLLILFLLGASMHTALRSMAAAVTILVALICQPNGSVAAGIPSSAQTRAPIPRVVLDEKVQAHDDQINEIKAKLADITSKLKAAEEREKAREVFGFSADKWMLFLTFVLTGVLVITTVVSFRAGGREHELIKSILGAGETRASETHGLVKELSLSSETRARESHARSLESASVAGKYAENFLTGSQETLSLVNATLELAREATERTVKSAETRLRHQIEDYDREATAVISVAASHDDRRLVTDLEVRENLDAVAIEISAVEAEVRRLNVETLIEGQKRLRLTSACMFVLGMQHHLDGRWRKALQYWEAAVNSAEGAERLASHIWYWIGYEQNNVGRSGIDQAIGSFQRALESAVGVRQFELRRLERESRFFDLRPQVDLQLHDEEQRRQLYLIADDIARLAEELETKMEAEMRSVWRNAVTTIGNIRLSVGHWWLNTRGEDKEVEWQKNFLLALVSYDIALETATASEAPHIWALFGRAQALQQLQSDKHADFMSIVDMLRDTEVGEKREKRKRNLDKAVVMRLLQRDAMDDYREVLRILRDTEFGKRREPRTRMLYYATQMRCGLGIKNRRVAYEALAAIRDHQVTVEEPVTIYSPEMKCNVDKKTWLKEIDVLEVAAKNLKNNWLEDD